MALYFSSLNSGSNANCYYAGTNETGLLIDAGLSCRETEKRMKSLGLPMENLRGIFISHEHSDHIYGLPGLVKKYRLPVFITAKTLSSLPFSLEEHLVRPFSHGRSIELGELEITPFRKNHDAADPHSFIVSAFGIRLGVLTDIGFPCKRVIRYFSKCDAAFLESNYCEKMLENGDYPWHLKQRIRGDEGHLSNDQALELFVNYRSPAMKMLILSHLSKNNNHPELVESMFRSRAGNTEIVVASRYEAGKLFMLEGKTRPSRQLSLF
ncbi:MAG: MBL fold metallo-hydrolase [Chitinophagaceae bacterium]|nr:MBL fold metallo-hydrolase [Chitinophagaceae bacterium]